MRTVSINEARATIKSDFERIVNDMHGIKLPEHHVWHESGILGPPHQLTWAHNCAVESSESGASIHAGIAPELRDDPRQLRIEMRYHHPRMRIRTKAGRVFDSRPLGGQHGALIFIGVGRPYVGECIELLPGGYAYAYGDDLEELINKAKATVKQGLQTYQLSKRVSV